MKKRIQTLCKPALLTAAALLTMMALLAPPAVVKAAPECNIEEITNSQGQNCFVCVNGGEGADCKCGGMICFT